MQFIYLCQKAMVTFFDPGNRSFAICWKLIPYDYVDGWLVGWLSVWHDENDLVVHSANHLSSRPSVHPFIHLFIYAFHSFSIYHLFIMKIMTFHFTCVIFIIVRIIVIIAADWLTDCHSELCEGVLGWSERFLKIFY